MNILEPLISIDNLVNSRSFANTIYSSTQISLDALHAVRIWRDIISNCKIRMSSHDDSCVVFYLQQSVSSQNDRSKLNQPPNYMYISLLWLCWLFGSSHGVLGRVQTRIWHIISAAHQYWVSLWGPWKDTDQDLTPYSSLLLMIIWYQLWGP